jgi:dienelactone hydrolase
VNRSLSKAALLLILGILNPTSSDAQLDSTFSMEPISSEAFEVLRHFFKYDKDIPLDARVVNRYEWEESIHEKIVFSGTRNNRVPGILALPKSGVTPYPCVLLLHGISGNKEGWWEYGSFSSGGHLTKQLLSSGFAVLALDAEYHGERLLNNDFESLLASVRQKGWFLRGRDMFVQSIVEYQRAIDYLNTRAEIDISRIGINGYSMGGQMTFSLTAVDPRIKTSVACVTPISKDRYSATAVYNYAPYISRQPFLMLMGKTDRRRRYTVEEAQQLHDLITSQFKQLVFFESGHQLPVDWTKTASKWVENYLK